MRVDGGALIDRTRPISFKFNGTAHHGFSGDSVASALLAAGHHVISRSARFDRPRGIMSDGAFGPGISAGSHHFPLPLLELTEGAEINASAARRPSETAKPPPQKLACDVLIIGSGPAGILAALTAASAGVQVLLCDQDFCFGGRLNSETDLVDGVPGYRWAAQQIAKLAAMENVRLISGLSVVKYDMATERYLAQSGTTDIHISARGCILASGATERPIAFSNNDRPGVMMASAVRGYLNRFGAAFGRRVVVFGNNDGAFNTARDLDRAGLQIAAYVDSRTNADISGDFPIFTGATVSDVSGNDRVRSVKICKAGSEHDVEADCLAISGGWNPNLQIIEDIKNAVQWNDNIAGFIPRRTPIPNFEVAGAAGGTYSTKGCLKSGVFRAKAVLKQMGISTRAPTVPRAEAAPTVISPLWSVPGRGPAWMDLDDDLTVGDVKAALAEGEDLVTRIRDKLANFHNS